MFQLEHNVFDITDPCLEMENWKSSVKQNCNDCNLPIADQNISLDHLLYTCQDIHTKSVHAPPQTHMYTTKVGSFK